MPPDPTLFFRSLADNSPLFVAMCDMDYKSFYINDAGLRLVGLDEFQQFVDTPVKDYFFPEDQGFILNEFFPRVLREGRAETEIRFRHFRTGAAIWMTYDVFFLPGADGTPVGLATVSRDISERKRVEDALRASERRFHAIFEHQFQFSALLDPDTRVVEISGSVFRATGGSRDEVEGKSFLDGPWWRDLPEVRAQWRRQLEQARAGHEASRDEIAYRIGDGSIRHAVNTVSAVLDDSGALEYFLVEGVDITDRKAAEEALQKANRLKDEFLAVLAHELRNPLAPISNGVEILSRQPDIQISHRKVLGMMARQTQQLVRLVDELVDVSRISRGKVELQLEHLDLRDKIAVAVETSDPNIRARNHKLDVRMPADEVIVDADPVRIVQLFANLLNNAAKFTEDGGEISLRLEVRDGYAVVQIRDTGAGIAADLLPVIFEPFKQGATARNRYGGLGVGLALARGLVEMHGGAIEARSEGIGRGSEFIVRLPLATARAKNAN